VFVSIQSSAVDVNSTTYGLESTAGQVKQISLTGAVEATSNVSGGATSVSTAGDKLIVAGADQMHDVTPDGSLSGGLTSEIIYNVKLVRRLWLRLE
jgi:hypothetical protein